MGFCDHCGSDHKKFDNGPDCPHVQLSFKPRDWSRTLKTLNHSPLIKGNRGRKVRMKLLKQWSSLQREVRTKEVHLAVDDMKNMNIDKLAVKEVYLWAHLLQISGFDNENEARRKLKIKLNKLNSGTTETYSETVGRGFPYICSVKKNGIRKVPVPNKMRLEHVIGLVVNNDDPFEHLGKNCPEPGCNGKVESRSPIL